ncbi:pyridoxal phosphate-dependent aminotransferase [Photobacterium sp. DNB23_23_1]
MSLIEDKFAKLDTEHAPGQEGRLVSGMAVGIGDTLGGTPVDFSHGDVNPAAFAPPPTALEAFIAGEARGGSQAYTEYRGDRTLRGILSERLSLFTGKELDGENELILTPGTQGALFLAIASCVVAGDKVAIMRPDYFANRKLVEFLGAEIVPVEMDYLNTKEGSGICLDQLEAAFKAGAKTFLFSNPNNPTGVVYSAAEITQIASLANRYGSTVIVDQLYSRLLYSGVNYTHLRATDIDTNNVVTIMGPSKTESLSGYRLGVAFGAKHLIARMEKLQAIVSLRAPGYCQAVFNTWFAEPDGWIEERIRQHQSIRDDLLGIFLAVPGINVRPPEAGSYLFPQLPKLSVPLYDFLAFLRSQAAVTVTPGTEFSPNHTDSIRLNFSQNHSAAVHAVERIAGLVDRYRA